MHQLCDWNVVDVKTTRYRRTHNTPVHETEKELNCYYGGWRTILTNSGMEAVNSVFDLVKPATVIVDDETYFETRHYWAYRGNCEIITLRDIGIEKGLEVALAVAKKPVIVCIDTPTTFGIFKNLKRICQMTHKYPNAYVMADNSIVSLYYFNPIRYGADIVVESYTKYVCGYGDCFAGGIALADSMKWLDDVEVPVPCPGMKSVDWILSRRGNVASPHAAYMVSRGLQTLGVRMRQHTASAKLIYKTLKEGTNLDVRYSGYGGLITLMGMTEDFCQKLQKFVTVGTFGCTYSNADFFRTDANYAAGVCARLSVGLEDPDILMDDLANALGLPKLMDVYRKLKENMKGVIE